MTGSSDIDAGPGVAVMVELGPASVGRSCRNIEKVARYQRLRRPPPSHAAV